MSLKVHASSPSFGLVTNSAVSLAKNRHQKDIEKLVASQEDNYNYNVSAINPDEFITPNSRFVVTTRDGLIIERFKSLEAACIYASALDKAEK